MKKAKYFRWLIVLIFSTTILLPLFLLIFSALVANGELSAANFLSVFQSSVLKSIANSLLISTLVGAISVAVGGVFAFLFAKTNLPFKNVLRLLFLLPLLLPPYITAVAWTDTWLYIGLPKTFIYSLPAVVFILTTIYIPLATFIIAGSLQNISASIEEAGEMMTDYRTVFLRIVLPLIRPALFSGFLLVFILSLSEFAVPSYLSVNVFTTEIFTQFTAFYNYSTAIAHALVLMLLCFLLIFPEKYYLARAPFISFGTGSFRIKIIALRNKYVYVTFSVLFISLMVLLPILMLFMQATSGNGNSFEHSLEQLLPAVKDTLVLSVLGALLLTFFGFVFAFVARRNKTIEYILLFVFATPAIVVGMALTHFYNTPSLNFIYGTSLIILLAFIARFLFISEKILSNSLQQIPPSYTEAATLLGANTIYTFRKITLPLMGEALFTSFFLMLIFCVSELTAVIMVYPPGVSLLPVRIFTLMANAPQSAVSAMSLGALLLSLIIIAAMFGIKKLLFNPQWKIIRS